MVIELTETNLMKFERFFRDHCLRNLYDVASSYPEKRSLIVDFQQLNRFDTELADELLNNPGALIPEAEEAVRHIDLPIDDKEWSMRIRFRNLPEYSEVYVRDLRSLHIGKLIGLDGIVRTQSEVRPQAVEVTFECPYCGQLMAIVQDEAVMREPVSCESQECNRRGRFKMVSKKFIDATKIRVQEPPDVIVGSEQPSLLYVDVKDDLVSPLERKKLLPGNRVKISGILHAVQMKSTQMGKSTNFDLILEASYVDTIEKEFADIDLSKEDIQEIKNLAAAPDVYSRLIASIAPSIYGYTDIKEAILLQLFAGNTKKQFDGTRIRGDIHIFLIGDPGTGKSQILRYVSSLAPRGKYVSGKGASAAGLTASVMKDEFTGGYILEAGALVLASGGIAAIDEFDKMSKEDSSAMHEALEQQTISIAKAGIVTTLNARTAVLAAANPKYGRFDPYRNIYEQIELSPALLSRFDLKFPIQDKPTKETDMALAEHVLNSFRDPNTVKPEFEPIFLRKYIAYSRKTCNPILTLDASERLKNFYVEWRTKYSDAESGAVGLTARQLEALVRLAESSAKIRLDMEVRLEDVDRATRILESSLRALGTEKDTGKLDIDRLETGISSVQRSKIHIMLDTIKALEDTKGKRILIDDIIAAVKEKGIDLRTAEELIDKLKQKGDVYEPGPGHIQRVG